MRVQRAGATSEPKSHTECVTDDQLKDPSQSIAAPPSTADEKCSRTAYEWTGSKLSWKMECSGKATISGGGKIVFDTPEHYSGTMNSDGSFEGHTFDSTILIDGTRVGECPK
jgi:Protein of unknown function (DUF3617)